MHKFKTLELAIDFYKEVNKIKITGNMKDQLQRAASSIPLNLSEGNGKSSANEKRHFFQTSYASLRECQTIFKLLDLDNSQAAEIADKLGAHLYRLVNSKIKNSPNWRKKSSDI